MSSHVDCIPCIINKANNLADTYIRDKKEKYKFMKKALLTIANTKYEVSSPTLVASIMKILKEDYGVYDAYEEEKKYYNDKILKLEEHLYNKIDTSDKPVLTGLKYAMSGNVIDYGALDKVDDELVDNVIDEFLKKDIDNYAFDKFKAELNNCKKLAYLGDNAGEIVFDKLFIKQLKKLYPDIDIVFITRGEPVLNDVTDKDASYVGMDKIVKVLNNGTDIAGTDLNKISKECSDIIDNADIIISKGQGNFETLVGCNKNIYYAFLCKCDLFANRLNTKKMNGVFVNDKDIKLNS